MRNVAVVPLKLSSRRLPNKNFLEFDGKPLATRVLNACLGASGIDAVFAHCSDNRILGLLPNGILWLPREKSIDGDAITANQLFDSIVESLPEEVDKVIVAHATAPFLQSATIERAITELDEYDSVTTVVEKRTYVWFDDSPLNYNPNDIVQTQEIKPVYLETSGLFGFRRQGYLESRSRLFNKIKLLAVGEVEAIDVDTPEDFQFSRQVLLGSKFTIPDQAQSFAPKPGLPLRSVTFDLDGVLIDSIEGMRTCWATVQSELGVQEPFESYSQHIGLPFLEILEQLNIPESERSAISDVYFRTAASLTDTVTVFPDVMEGLQKLREEKGLLISLFTSKPRSRTQAIVSEFFRDVFDMVITPEDIASGRGKPHPDGLLQILSTLGVDPGQALYVGDMESDFLAASRAGIEYAHAGWGYGNMSRSNATWFHDFNSLVAWLAE